jgi:hypothetical protein
VAALAAPPPASAKEVSQVEICGAGARCTTFDRSDFRNLMFLADDAGPTNPPAAAAPWFRVRFTVDEREHGGGYERWTVAYVPSADSVRVREEGGRYAWSALNPRAAAVLQRAARRLPALPKADLRGLRATPPEARVDRVFPPPARARRDPPGTPWERLAAVAVAAALAVAVVVSARRRRRVRVAATAT